MPYVADSTTPVTVIRALAVKGAGGVSPADAERWVWSITFRGSFRPLTCPSGPQITCDNFPQYHVVLDYFTGEWLGGERTGP